MIQSPTFLNRSSQIFYFFMDQFLQIVCCLAFVHLNYDHLKIELLANYFCLILLLSCLKVKLSF